MSKSNTGKGFRTASLIGKHLRGQLTEPEKNELDTWLNASEQNQKLFQELYSVQGMEIQLAQFENTDSEAGWQRLQYKINNRRLDPVKKANWKVWVQAAAAIFILVLVAWQVLYVTFNKTPYKPNLSSQYGEDVLPGSKKAQLVLSDGTTVALDANTDSSFTENGSSIQRTANGAVVYSKGLTDNDAAWNSIHIPNGGEYMVMLEDGTKVWLNAASALRYPVRFMGKERRVELTEGEAYFEIAKNKEKPFIVSANHLEVQAIGTAFDVNTYLNIDSSMSTTLTEGRVKVKANSIVNFLLPGEQVNANNKNVQVLKADVEAVTAWKNGLFIFKGTALPEVMEHIARWYDVKVEYDKTFTEKKFFTGEIKRNVPVSKLLEMMELTGIAKFRITNNTIVILPYTP